MPEETKGLEGFIPHELAYVQACISRLANAVGYDDPTGDPDEVEIWDAVCLSAANLEDAADQLYKAASQQRRAAESRWEDQAVGS